MSSIEAIAQSGGKERAKPFQTGGVLVVALCHFVHDVYSGFLAPLLPLLIDKFTLSLTRAGILSTVMQLPALLNPFIGVWTDRNSVRWLIILAPSLTAVPMSLIGLAPSYAVLLILLFTDLYPIAHRGFMAGRDFFDAGGRCRCCRCAGGRFAQ